MVGLFGAWALAGASGAAPPPQVLSVDGVAGGLRIDRSAEADVRRKYGRPRRVDEYLNGDGVRVREIAYRCGRRCETSWFLDARADRLRDVITESRSFETERGSRVRMPVGAVVRRERRRPGRGCPPGITLRGSRALLRIVLDEEGERVEALRLSSRRRSIADC